MPLVNTSFTSKVPNTIAKIALSEYLKERFSYHSLEIWLERIQAGLIEVNGQFIYNDIDVTKNDIIAYHIKNFDEPEQPTHIKILFENEQIAVINKTAPLPMQRTSRILVNTFSNLASNLLKSQAYALHRLDAETSGAVVFSKNIEGAKHWQKQLNQLIVAKFYLAIVEGHFNFCEKFEINLGEISDSKIRTQMFKLETGKPCQTSFYPIKQIEIKGNKKTLVLAQLHSGRKHQIRASLKELGHPIIGDKIYNHDGLYYLKQISDELSDADRLILKSEHHLLHAYCIHLNLVKLIEVKAPPITKSFIEAIAEFENWQELTNSKIDSISKDHTNVN